MDDRGQKPGPVIRIMDLTPQIWALPCGGVEAAAGGIDSRPPFPYPESDWISEPSVARPTVGAEAAGFCR